MDLCFFLLDGIGVGGVLLLLLALFLVAFVATHLRSVLVWVLIVGAVVLCIVYDLVFWIPLIGLALLVWGYGVHYLKRFIKRCRDHYKNKML